MPRPRSASKPLAPCRFPCDEGSPRFVLGVTARTTQGTLAIDGVASLDGTFSLKRQSVPVHALLPFTAEAPLGSLFQGAPLPQVAVKGATLNVEGDQATLDGRLHFGADYVPTLRGTLALKRPQPSPLVRLCAGSPAGRASQPWITSRERFPLS